MTTSGEWVDMAPGVRRRVMADGEKVMLVEIEMKVGAKVAPHQHMNEQISRVLTGGGVYTIGGVPQNVGPGGVVLVPGNVQHSFEATEDSLLIDAFSPPREDFRR
jgi:quercetin dioxygenase-like cupin family protein